MIEALWAWRVFGIQTLYLWAPCWFVWPAVELSCSVSPLYSSCATNKASRSHRGDSALFDLETSCSSLPLGQEPVEGAANPSTCIFRSSAKTQSQFSVFSPGLLGGNWYSFSLLTRCLLPRGFLQGWCFVSAAGVVLHAIAAFVGSFTFGFWMRF